MMTAAEAERALAEVLRIPKPRRRDFPPGAFVIVTDYSEEVAFLRAYIPWKLAAEAMRRLMDGQEEALRKAKCLRG